jgi:hypothetical protein
MQLPTPASTVSSGAVAAPSANFTPGQRRRMPPQGCHSGAIVASPGPRYMASYQDDQVASDTCTVVFMALAAAPDKRARD